MNYPRINDISHTYREKTRIKIRQGIRAEELKMIAILAMVADHCAVVFASESEALWILRMIGRLTAPIMCYFIAERYYHTSNVKKYMGRLLLMAIISHISHNLCLGLDVFRFWEATSVMVSLLCGLVALTVWKSEGYLSVWQKNLL